MTAAALCQKQNKERCMSMVNEGRYLKEKGEMNCGEADRFRNGK